MCVLWQSDPRGLVAFFFTVCPFCGVIKRGDNVDIVDIVDNVDKRKTATSLNRLQSNL